MDIELIPPTAAERQMAFLTFAAVVGGGLIAYEAGLAIRDGDLFKTDELDGKPKAGALALTGGLAMLAVSAREVAKETGWKALVLGGIGISAGVAVIRAIRR